MTLNLIDPAAPENEEPAGLGAQELRSLKAAILAQFAGSVSDPYNIPVTVGPRALNLVPTKADASDLAETQAQADANSLAIGTIAGTIATMQATIATILSTQISVEDALEAAWPVQSVFMSYDGSTPASKGFPGSWTRFADGKVLLGAEDPATGREGGSMSKTLAEANLPAHRHFVVKNQSQSNGADVSAVNTVVWRDTRGGGDLGYTMSGNGADADIGRSGPTGSGTAIDITPAYVKVAFYRRTA
jgi:hypothetical protein